jgi:4-carboxymuconolactone decarboxylase
MKTAICLLTVTGLLAMGGNAVSQAPGSGVPPSQPAAPKITVTPSGRITAPPVEQMNEEQKRQYEAGVRGFGGPAGPRMPLINSPEVAKAWQGTQDALAKSALPAKLREVAILAVAGVWKAEFEWYAHAKTAARQGIAPAAIEAIRVGKEPTFGSDAERIVYRYSHELVANHFVSDASYNAAWKLLGTRTLVDLTVLLGHYVMVSMNLNAHEVPLPDGVARAF